MKKSTQRKLSSQDNLQTNFIPKQPQINFSGQNYQKITAKKPNSNKQPNSKASYGDLRQSSSKSQNKAEQKKDYQKSLHYYKSYVEKYKEISKSAIPFRQNLMMSIQQKPSYIEFNRSRSLKWLEMVKQWGKDLTKQFMSHLQQCPIFKLGAQISSSKFKLPQIYKETNCDCTTDPKKIAHVEKQNKQRKRALKIKVKEYNKCYSFLFEQTPQKLIKNLSKAKTTSQKEQLSTIIQTPLSKIDKIINQRLISSPRNISLQSVSQNDDKNFIFRHKPQCQYEKLFSDQSTPLQKIKCSCLLNFDVKENQIPKGEDKKTEFIRNLFGYQTPLIQEIQNLNQRNQKTNKENLKPPLEQKYFKNLDNLHQSNHSKHRNFAQKYLCQYSSPKQKNRQYQLRVPIIVNSGQKPNLKNTKKTINQDDIKKQYQTPKRNTNNQISQKLAKGQQILKNQDPGFLENLKTLSNSSHLLEYWANKRALELEINYAFANGDKDMLEEFKLKLEDSSVNYQLNISEKDFKQSHRRFIKNKHFRDPDDQELQNLWSLRNCLNKEIKDRIRQYEDKIVEYERSIKQDDSQEENDKQKQLKRLNKPDRKYIQSENKRINKQNEQTQFRGNHQKQKNDHQNDNSIQEKTKVEKTPPNCKFSNKKTPNSPSSNKKSTPQRQEKNISKHTGSPQSSAKKKNQQVKQDQEGEQKRNKIKLLQKHKDIPVDIDLQNALLDSYLLSMIVNPSDQIDFQLINKSNQYILRGLKESKRLKDKKEQAQKLLKKAQQILDQTESQQQQDKLNMKFHQDQLTTEQLWQIIEGNQKKHKLFISSVDQYFRQSLEGSQQIVHLLLRPNTLNKVIPEQESPLISCEQKNSAKKKFSKSIKREKEAKKYDPQRYYSEFKGQMEVLKMIDDEEDRKQLEKNFVINSLRKTDINFERSIKKQDQIVEEDSQPQINEVQQGIMQDLYQIPINKNQSELNSRQLNVEEPGLLRREQIFLKAFQQIQQRSEQRTGVERQSILQQYRSNQEDMSALLINNPNRRLRNMLGAGQDGSRRKGDNSDKDKESSRDNQNNRNSGDPSDRNNPNRPPSDRNLDYAHMILNSVPHYRQLQDIIKNSINSPQIVRDFNNRLLQFRLTLFANYVMVCCHHYPSQMKQRIHDFWRKDIQILTYFKTKSLEIPKPFQDVIALLSIGVLQYSETFCNQDMQTQPYQIRDSQYENWLDMEYQMEDRRLNQQQAFINYGAQLIRQKWRAQQKRRQIDQQEMQRRRQEEQEDMGTPKFLSDNSQYSSEEEANF